MLLIIIIIGMILLFAFPSLEFQYKLWSKARQDYGFARGTQHKKILRNCLKNLRKTMKDAELELRDTMKYQEDLVDERRDKLETAASTYLVYFEFTDIPGIGVTLRDRIIRACFDGTLRSLRGAERVCGIGEKKTWAIHKWVDYAERKLPRVLKGYFPNKDQINQKYNGLEKTTKQKIMNLQNFLDNLYELEEMASRELTELKEVTTWTFLKSNKGDAEASEAVTNYLPGVFPEWERIPKWFKTLIDQYGQAS